MTSINELSKITGISSNMLRHLISTGKLPIAAIDTKGNNYTNYYLLPPKVYEYLGVKIDGYEPPPSVALELDYEMFAKEVAKEITAGMAMAFKE